MSIVEGLPERESLYHDNNDVLGCCHSLKCSLACHRSTMVTRTRFACTIAIAFNAYNIWVSTRVMFVLKQFAYIESNAILAFVAQEVQGQTVNCSQKFCCTFIWYFWYWPSCSNYAEFITSRKWVCMALPRVQFKW